MCILHCAIIVKIAYFAVNYDTQEADPFARWVHIWYCGVGSWNYDLQPIFELKWNADFQFLIFVYGHFHFPQWYCQITWWYCLILVIQSIMHVTVPKICYVYDTTPAHLVHDWRYLVAWKKHLPICKTAISAIRRKWQKVKWYNGNSSN